MNIPTNLRYSKSHEWVLLEGGKAKIGLTDHAQSELGDLVFLGLPQVGDMAVQGETICDVESVKAVSDVYSPLSGKVSAVNEDLLDAPEKLNEAPYEAWLFELEDVSGEQALMDAAAYAAHCESEG